MKAFRIFYKNVRDGFKSVGRNMSLSVASISCITITLLIISIAIIVSCNIENMTKLIQEDFTIVAFMDLNSTKEDIDKVKNEILEYPNVDKVTFESKKEVALEMKDSSSDLASIIDSWSDEENPLYDTLLIKVKDPQKINGTAKKIENIKSVVKINYLQGMVESLMTVFNFVEKAMVVAMVALLLVTLFLINNTIKITIFSRKREIEIMRLVGASNISIKQPFVIEGLCLGFLGAIIPVCVTLYGYDALFKHFNGQLFSPFFKLIPSEPFIYMLSLVLIGLGIIIGMFGSYRAVRKYLKI